MANGTEAQPNTKTDAATPPAGATPPGGEPPKPEAKAAPPPPAPAPEPPKQAADRVPTRKLLGDEDDIPDDADLIEMSPKKLKGRLERHTKKQLRDRFGTDDPDEIKGRLDKLAKFEEEQEKQRQAQLSETERLKEQLAAAEKARLDAEHRVEQAHLQRVLETEDRRAARILAKYVDEDDIEDVIPKLARHINGLGDADLVNPDVVIDAWAKDFVERKPKFAKASIKAAAEEEKAREEKAKADAAKPPPAKVPLTTGTAGGKPGAAADVGGPKTAAPGRPNSMTDAEWREYRRQNGIAY